MCGSIFVLLVDISDFLAVRRVRLARFYWSMSGLVVSILVIRIDRVAEFIVS